MKFDFDYNKLTLYWTWKLEDRLLTDIMCFFPKQMVQCMTLALYKPFGL